MNRNNITTAVFAAFLILSGCSDSAEPTSSQSDQTAVTGKNGSMARFTQVGDYLYTLNSGKLKVANVTNPKNPQLFGEQQVDWDSETLFPMDSVILIGGQTGMAIYSVEHSPMPSRVASVRHFRSCDPVVSDGNYAYVTLRGGSRCGGSVNELEIYDIQNLSNPILTSTFPMYNPHGLAVDDSLLFICDGKAGIKVYTIVNARTIKLLQHIGDFEAYDVILTGKSMIAVGKEELVQYDYSTFPMKKLSSIPIG